MGQYDVVDRKSRCLFLYLYVTLVVTYDSVCFSLVFTIQALKYGCLLSNTMHYNYADPTDDILLKTIVLDGESHDCLIKLAIAVYIWK